MSDTAQPATPDRATWRPALPLWAALAGLVHYIVLQVLALIQTGGVFEYPLDDVYIHLEMARSIAGGGYGVNPGEFASADSSVLYPLLLTPMAGTEVQRYLPALVNMLALLGCGWAWGKLIAWSEFGRFPGMALALAAIGPVALNMAGVAFLGMEHSLHALVSLMVLLGLIVLARDNRVGWLLSLGIVLGPLLRPEGLAISLTVCAYLLLSGARRAGLLLTAGAVLPFAGFVAFLTALGIGPLPSSVMAKLSSMEFPGVSGMQAMVYRVLINLFGPMGVATVLIVLAVGLGLLFARPLTRKRTAPIVLIAMVVAPAHLILGKMGWSYRYEHYMLVFLIGAAVYAFGYWALAGRDRMPALAPVMPAIVLALPLSTYLPLVLAEGPASARAVYLQQRQLGRIAKEVIAAPVAVNDIGWVAYRNPDYVVDLWGLASSEALAARQAGMGPGWADGLPQRHGADLAMVYERWLGPGAGPDWVRLGELELTGPQGFVAAPVVIFYATRPEAAAGLRDKLAGFVPSLPEGARFSFAEGLE
ncbi:hypothetical protein Ga0609869_000626 [Rhodovulum iodosum]|uniref:Glycosyltransferase RgtA/B/C/D-like domain-containing protein n=1 Tax=Rhodovulum iodosum TaxID=68291 RepID=A0ABV3XSA7_9RHOB|nr:hypothetical protein [Rhodovulum robiginosum]RSK31437.1 hypothetical protein EJA01_14960 [Rhodovulum robiginosum]